MINSKNQQEFLKGVVKVELFNDKSGDREFVVEKNNLILSHIFSKAFQSMLAGSFRRNILQLYTGATALHDYITPSTTPIADFFNNIYLINEVLDVDPLTEDSYIEVNSMTGWVNLRTTYSGDDVLRGSINLSESTIDFDNNKIRIVVDWTTSAANGVFQSVSFGHYNALGPAAYWNYMVNLRYSNDVLFTTAQDAKYSDTIGKIISGVIATTNNCKLQDPLTGVETVITLRSSIAGTEYTAYVCGVTDTDVYFKFNGSAIMKYSLPLVDLQNATVNLAIPTELVNYVENNIFVLNDTRAFVKPGSAAIDPVTGESFNKYIYEFNPSTATVLSRIRVPDKVLKFVELNSVSLVYPGWFGIKYDETNDTILFSMNHTGFASFVEFNITKEEYRISYLNGQSGTNKPNFIWMPDGLNAYRYAKTFSTASNKYGFYKIIQLGNKQSRVLLPSPVTKLDTQNLKVTYDLIFSEGIM